MRLLKLQFFLTHKSLSWRPGTTGYHLPLETVQASDAAGATSFSSSLPQTKFFNHMGSLFMGIQPTPPNRCPLSPMGDLRPVQLMKFVKPPFLGSKKYPISQHFPWPNSWCHQDSVTIYQVPESGGVYSLLINESEKDVHGPNIRNPSLVFKKHGRFSQMGAPQLIVYPLEI
jgi:hypothetical protein